MQNLSDIPSVACSDKSANRSRWRWLGAAVVFAVIWASFFLIGQRTPLVLDDYYALYRNPGIPFFELRFEDAQRIESFSDVVVSARNVYRHWTGRFFWTVLAQSLLMADKIWFDCMNACVAVAVVWLLCRHIAGTGVVHVWLLVLVTGLFWLCAPAPGLTFFMVTVATTYLWMSCLLLLFLLPYRQVLDAAVCDGVAHRPFLGLALFLAGGVVCNSSENTGGALLLLVIVMGIARRRQGARVPFWMIAGGVGCAVGLVLLLLAPGTMVRLAIESRTHASVMQGIALVTGHLFHTIPALVSAVGALAYLGARQEPTRRDAETLCAWLYAGAGIAAAYALAFSPYVPARAFFGPFIFLLCSAGILVRRSCERQGNAPVRMTLALGVAVMAGAAFLFAWRDIGFTGARHCERLAYVAARRQVGEGQFRFRPVIGTSVYNALYKTDVLAPDPDAFVNRYYAQRLGVQAIATTPLPALVGMTQSILPDE